MDQIRKARRRGPSPKARRERAHEKRVYEYRSLPPGPVDASRLEEERDWDAERREYVIGKYDGHVLVAQFLESSSPLDGSEIPIKGPITPREPDTKLRLTYGSYSDHGELVLSETKMPNRGIALSGIHLPSLVEAMVAEMKLVIGRRRRFFEETEEAIKRAPQKTRAIVEPLASYVERHFCGPK